MLILNLIDESDCLEKKKKIFSRKKVSDKDNPVRYSLTVNGKNVVVLELTSKALQSADVQMLLKIYKGRVLVSGKNVGSEILKDYIFNPCNYYKQAILSSLVNQIKTVNNNWRNVCIKTVEFTLFKEFYEVARFSKKLTLITQPGVLTDSFFQNCYYDFGAVINVKNDDTNVDCDVYLNLDEVDVTGRVLVSSTGKNFLLYPDITYFKYKQEFEKLAPYGIEHNVVCAAFS